MRPASPPDTVAGGAYARAPAACYAASLPDAVAGGAYARTHAARYVTGFVTGSRTPSSQHPAHEPPRGRPDGGARYESESHCLIF